LSKKLIDYLHQLIEAKKIKAADIAALLNISKDGAYRKLRGETDFFFNEVLQLQNKLGFSMDAFMLEPNTTQISFAIKRFSAQNTPEETVGNYINQLLFDFSELSTLGAPHMYYAAKDLPLFCFFSSNVLTSFKLYFWEKTLFSSNKPSKYKANWLPEPILQNAAQLYTMYQHIDSTEIWNQETINSTLDQIVYCLDTGLIVAKDAKDILMALHRLIDELESNATDECKKNGSTFKLYFNKILILDNSVLFKIGEAKMYYLPLRTINFLTSSDPYFTTDMEKWLHDQIKKSVLISGEAQKERTMFMQKYRHAIDSVMKKLE
jgi:hypothetical protein